MKNFEGIEYLIWAKAADEKALGRQGRYNLHGSYIEYPAELLLEDIRHRYFDELMSLIRASNPWGHPELIKSIKSCYGVSEREILTTQGASSAIFLVCMSFLSPGDHAIVEKPVYEPLYAAPVYAGAETDFIQRRPDDYGIDPDELRRLMKRETRLIVLTNMHNPSGRMLSDERLLELSEAVREQNGDIRILVDEVYHDYAMELQKPSALLDGPFISINSFSKVYGLSDLRCGWIIAGHEDIEKFSRLQVLASNIGSQLNESLAVIVLRNQKRYLQYAGDRLATNRRILQEAISPLADEGLIEGSIPEHGCIYFPKLCGIGDTHEFAARLAAERGVYVVPGRYFQQPDGIRIGFGGNPEKLKTGLSLLSEALRESPRFEEALPQSD